MSSKKVAFIGFGNMGKMLVQGFLSSKKVLPNEMTIASAPPEDFSELLHDFPGVQVGHDNVAAAAGCSHLFLCVKPHLVMPILESLLPVLSPRTHVISIAAGVSLDVLEGKFQGMISRVIPSLTSTVQAGVSLVCHGAKVGAADAELLQNWLQTVSLPKLVQETDFDVATDLTSCAPGMIAAIFEQFVLAGVRHSALSEKDATDMVVRTLYGTAKLLEEKKMDFRTLIQKVATRGGITEVGVALIDEKLPVFFDELFVKTVQKSKQIGEQFK